MTVAEMHTAVKLGLDKTSSLDIPAFESEEIDLWLNIAQDRFIKQRVFGNNPKGIAFEGDNKRLEDIRPLILTEVIENSSTGCSAFFDNFVASTKYPNTRYIRIGNVGDVSVSLGDNDFTFAVDESVTDASADFVSAGFRVGMIVSIADSVSNDAICLLDEVTAGILNVHPTCEFMAEVAGADVVFVGDTVNSTIPLFNYFISARLTVSRTHPVATDAMINCNLINHELLPKFLETYSNSPRFINPVIFFEGDKLYVTVDSLTTCGANLQKFYVTYITIPARITKTPSTYANVAFPITDLEVGSNYRVNSLNANDTVVHDKNFYFGGVLEDRDRFKATRAGANDFNGTPTLTEIGECELPNHTHQEIVDIAVNLMIENIESPRFGTNLEKLKTQE